MPWRETSLATGATALLFATLSLLLLLAEKVALRFTARYVRASGYNYRSVLIVGTGHAAAEVVDSIENHRYWGFKVLGFIEANGTPPPWELAERYPVMGGFDDIARVVEGNIVDDVIFVAGGVGWRGAKMPVSLEGALSLATAAGSPFGDSNRLCRPPVGSK